MGNQLLEKWLGFYDISVIESNVQKRKRLTKLKINLLDKEQINDTNYEFIVLCIKPNDFKSSVGDFLKHAQNNQKIISIMAGLNIRYIEAFLRPDFNIIRVMPNLYSGIGHGISGIFCNKKVKKKEINSLIGILGDVLWLKKESELDFITAFFGGAPAYFFLFLSIIQKVLRKKNLDPSLEKSLILKLLKGTNKYLKKNNTSFDVLISKVASKGGTTEEALNFLNKDNQFFNLFDSAINLATKKSKSLNV